MRQSVASGAVSDWAQGGSHVWGGARGKRAAHVRGLPSAGAAPLPLPPIPPFPQAFSDRDALVSVHQGLRLSWRQLHAQAERAARGLLALGVQVRPSCIR